MADNYGIDLVKSFVKALADIHEDVEAAQAETSQGGSKITLMEGGQLAISAIPKFWTVATNGKEFVNQVSEISEEEKEELKSFFAAEYDLEDDKAEEAVELIFSGSLDIAAGLQLLFEKEDEELAA